VAVAGWEKAIAATIVHYLNQVLRHMGRFGTPEYSFLDHAKHWSEATGFALGLQLNPRSHLSHAQQVRLLELLREAPVLPGAADEEVAAYRAGILEARDLLRTAYGFADANIGTVEGEGGW
jgi:hypothetical protein